jgi:hypothetical protein
MPFVMHLCLWFDGLASFRFSYENPCMKYAWYKERNMSARKAAQLVPIVMLIVDGKTRPTNMLSIKNSKFLYLNVKNKYELQYSIFRNAEDDI